MFDEVAGGLALQSPMFIPGAVTSAINKLSPFQYLGSISPDCEHFKATYTASPIMVRAVVWLFLVFVSNTPLGSEQLYLSWTLLGWGHHSRSHWGDLIRDDACSTLGQSCVMKPRLCANRLKWYKWVALSHPEYCVRSALLLLPPSPGPWALLNGHVYVCWETGKLGTELWRPPWLLVAWRVQPTSCTGS